MTDKEKEDVSWFFTEEWQIGERAADEDLESGRFKDFNIDELLADLRARHEKKIWHTKP